MAETGTVVGALVVDIADRIDDEVARQWYAIYRAAFEPLASRAVARQVLHEEEFLEEMVDPRVWKYVARDLDGEVVGLTTITSHLETVPWISPQWFAHHYPEQYQRGAVYYLGFTLATPGRRFESICETMLSVAARRLVAEDAVCGYDLCTFNIEIGFRAGIDRFLAGNAAAVATVDTQQYFTADFSAAARGGRP